jgi:hypothetical protein
MRPSTLSWSFTFLALVLTACSGATTNSAAPNETKYQTGDWSCVGALGGVTPQKAELVVSPKPTPENTFSVHLVEAYSNAPVGGVQVAACNAFDFNCASPLDQVRADDTGLAVLTVPGGLPAFEGYLRLTGAMPENDVFFAGRASPNGIALVDVTVYTAAALGVTASLAGATLAPQQGLVRVDAFDCSHAAAAAVALAIAPGSEQPGAWIEYFVNDGAVITRDAAGTDVTGVAFVFGVVPGAIGVSGTVAGKPLGEAVGFVHAGAVTSLVVPAITPAGAPGTTSCCVSGSVTACCDDLQSGDIVLFDVPGNGVDPVGCWAGGSSGLACTAGAGCTMLRAGQTYAGTCGAP